MYRADHSAARRLFSQADCWSGCPWRRMLLAAILLATTGCVSTWLKRTESRPIEWREAVRLMQHPMTWEDNTEIRDLMFASEDKEPARMLVYCWGRLSPQYDANFLRLIVVRECRDSRWAGYISDRLRADPSLWDQINWQAHWSLEQQNRNGPFTPEELASPDVSRIDTTDLERRSDTREASVDARQVRPCEWSSYLRNTDRWRADSSYSTLLHISAVFNSRELFLGVTDANINERLDEAIRMMEDNYPYYVFDAGTYSYVLDTEAKQHQTPVAQSRQDRLVPRALLPWREYPAEDAETEASKGVP